MVEAITGKAASFVADAMKVPKRVGSFGLSPLEIEASDLIEQLVDEYGVDTARSGVIMPNNHPLRGALSITEPFKISVGDVEVALRAGDLSTGQPSSCPDLFFRLVAEPVSNRPRRALTLANVDPRGRVTGRNRRRLNTDLLEGFVSILSLMALNLDSGAKEQVYHEFYHPEISAEVIDSSFSGDGGLSGEAIRAFQPTSSVTRLLTQA